MNFEIKKETYDEIAKVIESDNSPVGIDAKKTHIIILKMLSEMNERLRNMEGKINELTP